MLFDIWWLKLIIELLLLVLGVGILFGDLNDSEGLMLPSLLGIWTLGNLSPHVYSCILPCNISASHPIYGHICIFFRSLSSFLSTQPENR